ncbi:MAG: hypothetical protein RPR91_05770 [Colwellia sp.]
MLTTTQIKYLAHLVSSVLIGHEQKFGQYDVNESIGALSQFNHLCQNITEQDAMAYMLALKTSITTTKDRMSEARAGEYSGGKGSLGSAFNKLNDLVSSHAPYNSMVKSLKKELKEYGVKWRDVVTDYSGQVIEEKHVNTKNVFFYAIFSVACLAILGFMLGLFGK